MDKKIAFIGHRNINCLYLRNKLYDEIQKQILIGNMHFIMGSHGEFDALVLNVCRELKLRYNDVQIEVVLTSLNKIKKQLISDDIFGKEYYEPYKDVQTVMFDIEIEHYKRQIIISNQIMLNSCNLFICYINKNTKKQSGAKLAMNYAIKKGIKIINLYPTESLE